MRLLREYFLHRFLFGRQRRRRGIWMSPRRGYYSPRRSSRSNVRVGGCCLPIPLALSLSAVGGLAALGRRRHI